MEPRTSSRSQSERAQRRRPSRCSAARPPALPRRWAGAVLRAAGGRSERGFCQTSVCVACACARPKRLDHAQPCGVRAA
eukprot:1831015-Alexandrium_andersonii.AAC.1